jgi:hypothetical protein
MATDDFNGQTYPLRLFLNGKEVLSSGLDAVSGDGNSVQYFDLTPFADSLHPGDNTIAVAVQNGWASDWDNMAFDLSLRAVPAHSTSSVARFQSICANLDGTVTMNITGPGGTRWKVQSASDPAASAAWQDLRGVTLGEGVQSAVTDAGSGARKRTQSTGARFYRLIPAKD